MGNGCESKKRLSWVEGNDVMLAIDVKELAEDGEQAVDLEACDEIRVTVHRVLDVQSVAAEYAIDSDVTGRLVVQLPPTLKNGSYELEVVLVVNGYQSRSFDLRFDVARCDSEANWTGEGGVKARSATLVVTVVPIIQALVRGKNAYEMWKELPGNEGKPLQEYIDTVLDMNGVLQTVAAATSAANDAAAAATEATEGAEKVDAEFSTSGGAVLLTVVNRRGVANTKEVGFRISKTYETIAAMNADAANVEEGRFVMIAGDVEQADTGKLYVKGATGFTFLTDLSGARGIKGDAFTYADFTPEQIAELQRPATEAAALADQKATEAGRVNASISGTMLTVTDRNGNSVTQDVQGPKGDPGDKGDPSTADIDIDGNEIVVTNNEGVEKRIDVNPMEELLQLNLQTDQAGLQEDPLDGVSVRVVQPDGTVLYSGQWQGEQISLYIKSTAQYKVLLGDVTGYLRPAERWIYPILHNVRNLTLTYVLGTIDTIYIDDAISDPAQKVSGDVNGPVLRWIRANTHNYLCKHDADRLTARMYVCQLDDTTRLRFHDGTLAKTDGTMGDVMNMLPDFYTRYGKDAAGRHKIEFARIDYGEGWMHWGGLTDLLGCYEMYVHNGLGYSRSGVGSTGSITQPGFKDAAQTRGAGYTIVKQWHQNVYGTLFYALYGHTNCQLVCGFGTSSYEKVCGADTDVLGMTDTVGGNGGNGNSGSINFLGLENWWGNKAEWVRNVEFNVGSVDYVYHITEDDGTVRLVQGHLTANTHTYKRGMTFGDHLDLIGTPSSANGSDSTGYCDSNYHGNQSARVVYRSGANAYANGGVAYSHASYAASYTGAGIGSRLAFHGEVVVVDRVADYLNL